MVHYVVAGDFNPIPKLKELVPSVSYKSWACKDPDYTVRYLDIRWMGLFIGFNNEKD